MSSTYRMQEAEAYEAEPVEAGFELSLLERLAARQGAHVPGVPAHRLAHELRADDRAVDATLDALVTEGLVVVTRTAGYELTERGRIAFARAMQRGATALTTLRLTA